MNYKKSKRQNVVGLPKKERRPLVFVFLGLFLLAAGAALMYVDLQDQTPMETTAEPVTYKIQQSVNAQPQYKQNSFFTKTPDVTNTAFIADITDSIEAQFNYTFSSDEPASLSYQHTTVASIKAQYGSNASSERTMSTVWTKQFILTEPVKGDRNAKTLLLNPVIRVPYAEYKKQMEQFRNTFSTPTTGELEITHTVQVTGSIRQVPITDTKISTITVPLDQQVYQLATRFEKSSDKEVVQDSKSSKSIASWLDLPVAVALISAGIGFAVYGLRKQKFKSPEERELEKIYRYHAGIIVKAKHLSALINKDIVNIKSFDDMLNLAEELKTPIIATKESDYTTHFFITRDDVAYVYTHGIPIPFDKSGKSPTSSRG